MRWLSGALGIATCTLYGLLAVDPLTFQLCEKFSTDMKIKTNIKIIFYRHDETFFNACIVTISEIRTKTVINFVLIFAFFISSLHIAKGVL